MPDQEVSPKISTAGVDVSGQIDSVGGDIVGGNKIIIQTSEAVSERDVVYKLLMFLEDRRLMTEQFGYQSHFPDHLRQSAQKIRSQTVQALQQIRSDSPLVPLLKSLRDAARNFQAATEGAMDGERAGGGMTPHLPIKLSDYLESLLAYRQQIATAITEAADLYELPVDGAIRHHAAANSGAKDLIRSIRASGG